jgi:hypothetical protein
MNAGAVLKTSRSRLSAAFTRALLLTGVVIAAAQAPKSKRINQAIELLAQGQPIYYTGTKASGT